MVVRYLRAAAVTVGVIGAVVVAIAMLLGPLSDEPGPGAVERLVIFAYPVCLLLGGIFAALRSRIGLTYGLIGVAFGLAYVALNLTGDNPWAEEFAEQAIFAVLVAGPALILTSLCWSAMREESRLAV